MKFNYVMDEDLGPIIYVQILNRKFGLCACHRKKDRSIHFFGFEKYLCSRCMGLFFGGIIGLLLLLIPLRIPWFYLVLLLIPMLLDGFSQLFFIRESNNFLRLITGFCFGLALPPFVNVILAYIL